ncbi:bifunctional 2-polyprenyl-6-hydroxyphenol methylase/3-demethylubiquinol 3-O-methyltransferase UbiG [Ideonella sp. A 288]|uniref:class I SAM-dependent methyltransferase n=1 Tax=Ideonella sp. A 288 TaxID=1962181 RepID=UPI000B4A57C1|nr:class I SAM-dependent methyltransferase [Ideonella sp. A 288]
MHGAPDPSPWITRWQHLLAPQATVLDLACGNGRHVRWLAARGCRVTAVDRDAEAVAPLRTLAEVIVADLEGGPWPLADRRFGCVLVTNYLWRPLWPQLLDALAPGGVLLYETFAAGNETVGRPSRADFLLQPGELLSRCQGLRTVAFEDGFLPGPDRFVQRIAAVRPDPAVPGPARFPLPEHG